MAKMFPMPIKGGPIWPPKPVAGAKNLGDLVVDSEYYGNQRPEGAAKPGLYQPVAAPILPAPVPANSEDFMRLLAMFPDTFMALWRKKFLQIPRESYPMLASANAAVGANATASVVSFTVPDRMVGFITNLGFNVDGNNWDSIEWSLLVNGAVHPTLSRMTMFANSMGSPYPFPLEVIQSSQLTLQAVNTSGSSVNVEALIVGWLERLTPDKDYGGSAASGIG